MNEIEAIRQRHSVRNYLDKKIEKEKVDRLNVLIDECNKAGNLHFQFIEDAGKTFNKLLNRVMGLGTAPSVIACVGKDDETLDERVGYFGEKIVLAAQNLGLNTCWAGTFNRKNIAAKINDGERLAIVIAIGYGQNPGKEHKSKKFEEVTVINGDRTDAFDKGVEMALLAPTAINQQKFEIVLNADGTVTFTDKGGTLSRIDLGIVKYHYEVGSRSVTE
ncbi:MAG: nitroreductase family protein [Firmicutes bacterium]|nr:nitroreductase family protein [Bacillota bacterium]